jgi:hypothetical protein
MRLKSKQNKQSKSTRKCKIREDLLGLKVPVETMDYAIRILKELIKEIQNTPYEELKKTINEADTKYREILQKRGEQH